MLAATALAIGVSAVAGCSRSQPRGHSVEIRNFLFAPAELTVSRGDTVVWTNDDLVPHTATARDNRWDSAAIGVSTSWRFVADSVGRHEYYCVFHPNMKAAIVVR